MKDYRTLLPEEVERINTRIMNESFSFDNELLKEAILKAKRSIAEKDYNRIRIAYYELRGFE